MEMQALAILSWFAPPAISLLAGLGVLGGWAKYLFAAVLGLAGVLGEVQRWANDDLRSLNGQIEYLLRRALKAAGRVKDADSGGERQARPGRL